MDRSTRFGSISSDSSPYSDSLSLWLHLVRLSLATEDNSPAHYAKGTRSGIPAWAHRMRPYKHSPSTGYRQKVAGSISLPSLGFFSPFPHGTCSLSVDGSYLALEGGPPRFTQPFTWAGLLGNANTEDLILSPTGLSPSLAYLSR